MRRDSEAVVALEEADETVFWLEVMQETEIFSETRLREIVKEAKELLSIFVSSVRTAKGITSEI